MLVEIKGGVVRDELQCTPQSNWKSLLPNLFLNQIRFHLVTILAVMTKRLLLRIIQLKVGNAIIMIILFVIMIHLINFIKHK
jgi:hypothetical protein